MLLLVKVLNNLRRICPSLEHIKLDKRAAEAFPHLREVLKCHSQNTNYMIQFFKEPVIKNCSCKGCCDGLIDQARSDATTSL